MSCLTPNTYSSKEKNSKTIYLLLLLYYYNMDSLIRSTTPISTIQTDNNINIPNTRKRPKPNYHTLQNYGFQDRPSSPTILSRKKSKPIGSSQSKNQFDSQLSSQLDSQYSSQVDSQIELSQANSDNEILEKEKERRKRGWFWKYFIATTLDVVYKRDGKGQKEVNDILYTCDIEKNCKFERRASRMHSTTTALSNHLKNSYRIIEKTDPITVRSKNLILINQ